jgi:hypothetical protein
VRMSCCMFGERYDGIGSWVCGNLVSGGRTSVTFGQGVRRAQRLAENDNSHI